MTACTRLFAISCVALLACASPPTDACAEGDASCADSPNDVCADLREPVCEGVRLVLPCSDEGKPVVVDCVEALGTGCHAGACRDIAEGGACDERRLCDADTRCEAGRCVAPSTPEHTLVVTVTGEGKVGSTPQGIDCPGDCEAVFDEGARVTLSAAPNPGHVFSRWTGDCAATASVVEVEVTRDVSCTAVFNPVPTWTLTVAVTGEGTVGSAPQGIDCPGECEAAFDEGVRVTLSAAPNPGHVFSRWTGDCAGFVPGVEVELTRDVSCTAVFEPETVVEPACGSGGFCWETSPYVFSPGAVHGLGDGLAFAGADNGIVTRFAGRAWEPLQASTAMSTMVSVWASGPGDVYAVASFVPETNNVLRRFDGTTWTTELAESGLAAVWGTTGGDVWAAASSGNATKIFRKRGGTWGLETTLAGVRNPLGLRGSGANDVWLVVSCDAPWHFDGREWKKTALDGGALDSGCYPDLWATRANEAWTVRTDGGRAWFLKWDGTSWAYSDEGSPTGGWVVDGSAAGVWASGPDDVWVGVHKSGQLFRFDGERWGQVPLPQGFTLGNKSAYPRVLLWGSGPDDVWVLDSFSSFLRYDGTAFREVVAGVPTLGALSATGPDDVWATGSTLLGRDADGWRRVGPLDAYGNISPALELAVHARVPGEVWASGSSGRVGRYQNGVWTRWKEGVDPWYGVWATGADEVYVVGKNFPRYWNGSQWTSAFRTTKALRGIWGAGPDDVWAAGEQGLVVKFSQGEGTAVESGTTRNLRAVFGRSAKDVWFAGENGTLLHFDGTQIGSVATGTTDTFVSVAEGGDGALLLASPTKLYRYDGEALSVVEESTHGSFTGVWSGGGRTFVASDAGFVLAR